MLIISLDSSGSRYRTSPVQKSPWSHKLNSSVSPQAQTGRKTQKEQNICAFPGKKKKRCFVVKKKKNSSLDLFALRDRNINHSFKNQTASGGFSLGFLGELNLLFVFFLKNKQKN